MSAIDIKTLFKMDMDIRGKVYTINKPSLGKQSEYEQALKLAEKDGTSVFKLMIGYAVSLGLPMEIASELTNEEYTLVMEYLNGSKKNLMTET